MKKISIVFCFLFVLPAYGKLKRNDVLATVGKKKITYGYFTEKYNTTKNYLNRPSPRLFLQDLIRYEMGVQEAKRRNLRNSPVIKERLNQEMYKYLVDKAIAGDISKIQISENELEKEYMVSPEIRTSHIYISLKPGASKKEIAETYKRALKIYKKVAASKKSFAEQVALYSDDTISRAIGGDIGYQSRVSTAYPYYEAAIRLKRGQISKPVRSPFGFHIIQLTGKKPFAEADKRQLRAVVFERKRKVHFDRFFKKLGKNYSIKIKDSLVKKIPSAL